VTVKLIEKASYDPRRVFRFDLPKFEVGPRTRAIGTYLSGGLVSQTLPDQHTRIRDGVRPTTKIGSGVTGVPYENDKEKEKLILSSPYPTSSYSTQRPFLLMLNHLLMLLMMSYRFI
jgi:hypothetical protein